MHIIPEDGPDDVLHIYAIDGESDFYTVQYKIGENKRVHETNMGRADTCQYVSDLIAGLALDTSPADSIQFESCISPCILLDIADLGNCRVVHVIENTLASSLANVKRTA